MACKTVYQIQHGPARNPHHQVLLPQNYRRTMFGPGKSNTGITAVCCNKRRERTDLTEGGVQQKEGRAWRGKSGSDFITTLLLACCISLTWGSIQTQAKTDARFPSNASFTQNAEKLCTFFPLWLCTSPGLAHLFLLVCSGNFLRCTCTLTGRGTAYVAAYPIYFVFDISETPWACLPLPVLRAPTAAAFHKPSQAMKSAHSV
ncbi:hypothetical protein V8E51_007566 [Hyaloscypha variabilis]